LGGVPVDPWGFIKVEMESKFDEEESAKGGNSKNPS
jgi:hypothetical protein